MKSFVKRLRGVRVTYKPELS